VVPAEAPESFRAGAGVARVEPPPPAMSDRHRPARRPIPSAVRLFSWHSRGVVQSLTGLTLFALGYLFSFGALYLFAALFVPMGLLTIWSIQDNRNLIIFHGGNKCPNCGEANEIPWYD
jgi:hypothetical protein